MGVYLDCTPSTDKALRDSGTFNFVALHIFSAAGRHASAVAELALVKNVSLLNPSLDPA